MKKLLALVLVLCMVVGLVACTKKPPENTPTTAPTGSAPTTGETSFKGKTLQVYGFGGEDSYQDYSTFGKGNYMWMMRAAIDEWAHLNGVTIKYEGSYNQNVILAAMASGSKPDIIYQSNYFPAIANYGIAGAFTDEEYQQIAEVCGTTGYMDMVKYRNKAHGFVVPWSGNIMLYFNKSMFDRYDVKNPMEYFMEGDWTWENFAKCMEQMTKDLDADGTIDTYGLPNDSFNNLINTWKMDEKGNILSTIDEQWFLDFAQLKYDAYSVKNVVLSPGKNQIQKTVTYPMVAMQISDCEPYNFEHVFQALANGDELICVPKPRWVGPNGETVNELQYTQSMISLAASCDEREATMDLLCYLLKCGLKYISDFSLGTVKCDYAGIQGTSDLSKQWKEAFGKVVEDRKAAIEDAPNYDPALITKIYDHFSGMTWYVGGTYADVKVLTSYTELTKMPPASSIPAIRDTYQAALEKYNGLYIIG